MVMTNMLCIMRQVSWMRPNAGYLSHGEGRNALSALWAALCTKRCIVATANAGQGTPGSLKVPPQLGKERIQQNG